MERYQKQRQAPLSASILYSRKHASPRSFPPDASFSERHPGNKRKVDTAFWVSHRKAATYLPPVVSAVEQHQKVFFLPPANGRYMIKPNLQNVNRHNVHNLFTLAFLILLPFHTNFLLFFGLHCQYPPIPYDAPSFFNISIPNTYKPFTNSSNSRLTSVVLCSIFVLQV